jgi:chromosome condensin MukBEF MukE localization factor
MDTYELDSYKFPEYKDWSVVAIKLLQGVLYSDESISDWSTLMKFRNELLDYFARIGLLLVFDDREGYGYAYLRQIEVDDQAKSESDGVKYQNLPRLFRRSVLSYDVTVLCVLLRQRLHDFDNMSNLDDERCAIDENELFEDWKKMIPEMADEKKSKNRFDTAIKRLKEIHFIKQIGESEGQWEIRRIVKARITLEILENLRQQLQEALTNSNTQTTIETDDD